jgi:trigger factor
MNITRQDIDALNAVVKIDIAKADYSPKVEKILTDYRKTANIPGFRKGQVPMGMVKKQYGKAILAEEVNKILQAELNKYLTESKLDILGNPLPRMQDNIDWDNTEDYSFEFELGLSPKFDVDLKSKKAITQYNIVADKKMIDDQIVNIQKQYGKLISQDEAKKDSEITGTFTNESEGIENKFNFSLDLIKGKTNEKKFIGAKVGDQINLNTKGLFKDNHTLENALKIENAKVNGLNIDVVFEVNEVNSRELAELDQELFDKLFGKDAVKTVSEVKAKIKEDAEKQFAQQSDQKFLNDVTEHLVENTKFDLPTEFLTKWMQTAGEKQLTLEEAKEEFAKSEKSLRYQLIEGKLMQDNDLKVDFEDVKESAKGMIRTQMAQFGQTNPAEKELEDIAARVLSNQDEVRKISEQVVSQKLLSLYKEKANVKTKEMSYEDFVTEVYGAKK